MSDQRRFKRRSGRLASTPINDGWAIDLDSRDPSIPNLPLETDPVGSAENPAPLPHLGLVLGAAPTAYTLTADAGACDQTGVAAGLKRGLKVGAAQGSYAYTGVAAGLLATRTLTNIYQKDGSSGPLIFYEIVMAVQNDRGEPVVTERTTRILR